MRRRAAIGAGALAIVAAAAAVWALWRGGVIDPLTPRKQPEPPPIARLCRDGPDCRLTMLARLQSAPYPYEFREGEPAPAGSYRDDRVLIHVPPRFDPAKPFVVFLYFHGHGSTLAQTVVRDHALPAQINASGRNVILVAPQLAVDAADSHPGKLVRKGAARRLVADALAKTAAELGLPAPLLADAGIAAAAYSGGWWALADTLTKGGLDGRVSAVFLLDAFYGGSDALFAWVTGAGKRGGFVALYTESSEPGAEAFLTRLKEANREIESSLPRELGPGAVAAVRVETPHLELPLKGPPDQPFAELLRRLPPFGDAVPDPAKR